MCKEVKIEVRAVCTLACMSASKGVWAKEAKVLAIVRLPS